MTTDLTQLSAGDAGRLIQSRKISPVELVDAFLSRIEAVDERLYSYLLVTADTARAAARQAEADILAGRWRGPLHGIPYAVKDNYYTRGVRTCAASRLLMDHIPDHSATAVEKLDAAGAIMLGKLNTWEYGTGGGAVNSDLPFKSALNPWNLGHSPGGSSTGAGASVAGGTAMVAMGSDTGGSVRLPSAACGLQGIRSTYGRVSRHGILPNCYSMDVPGPLTATVEDCAIMLRTVAGYDPRDPGSANREVPDYLAGLNQGVRGLTIGVVRDLGKATALVDPGNWEGVEDLIQVLSEEGASIVEVTLPSPIDEYRQVTSIINCTESCSIHEKELMTRSEEMGQGLRDKLMAGFLTRAVDYLAAQRRRREMAESLDALIRSVDVLVLPCAFHTAAPYSDTKRVAAFTAETACHPFSASSHPAMSVCTGYDEHGLPTNAQIAGRWFDEATVLRVARAYERARDWRSRRPVF